MIFRAVGNRCAVILNALNLPISCWKTLVILEKAGFILLDVDMVALARQCIGTSKYRRGARASLAPVTVDCSSFVKWLYGMRGIWLPRRSIQQCQFGEAADFNDSIAGDVVFVSGRIDYYFDNPTYGIGHVGMATGEGTVIHAASMKEGVTESLLSEFIGNNKFRCARRYIPKDIDVLTFQTPSHREVETADDMRWIVLQSL